MFLRKLTTTNRETEELASAIDLWVVEWPQRYGQFSSDRSQAFQAFESRDEAVKFKESLLQANKLIGNTEYFDVKIYKKQHGL